MNLILEWSNKVGSFELPQDWVVRLEKLLSISGELEGIHDGEVALTFVDDATIHELNKQYRGIDQPTDVLSFAMNDSNGEEIDISFVQAKVPQLLGDIIISVPTARRQSEDYGHSLEREIGFLFVHGFLHLIGYDHQDAVAEKEMFAKQEQILQKAGLNR